MAIWPLTNRQSPDSDQYSESRQLNKISFEPEVGPSIDRRRGTAAGTTVSIHFTGITEAERVTFENWYEDILFDGTLPFDWLDPVRGEIRTFKFTQGAYELKPHAGNNYHDLTFKLLRFP